MTGIMDVLFPFLPATFNFSQFNHNPSLQPSFARLRALSLNVAGKQNSMVKPELIAMGDDLPSFHLTGKRRFESGFGQRQPPETVPPPAS
jgi:hypothetical protein